MYSIGWYSAPGCLPDSVEDAWDAVASDLYMYGDDSLWEYAQDLATRTGVGVADLGTEGLAYVEVWRTES